MAKSTFWERDADPVGALSIHGPRSRIDDRLPGVLGAESVAVFRLGFDALGSIEEPSEDASSAVTDVR